MTITMMDYWWGFLDEQGLIHIIKYKNDKAIELCEMMPFCRGIFDPFQANSYEDAKKKIIGFLDVERQKSIN